MPQLIAQRKLLYSSRDNAKPFPFTVGITAPRDVATGTNEEALPDAMSACDIVFDGLDAPPIEVRGADSLQAVAMAAEIDGVLRGLARQHGYQFFWDDGSAYFEPSV
jgi:hypothetical protein